MSSQDSKSELLWIRRTDSMPSRCCSCGMFADYHVAVKQTELVQKANSPDSCLSVILFLIFHVALGPVGWLLTVLLGLENLGEEKTVKKKYKIKITQCRLCNAVMAPEVVEFRANEVPQFAFEVHPEFRRRFEIANEEKI